MRVVGEGIEQGVYSIREALRLADDQGLDLVVDQKHEGKEESVWDYSNPGFYFFASKGRL